MSAPALRRRVFCSYSQFSVRDIDGGGVYFVEAHQAQGFARSPDFIVFTTMLEWPWAVIEMRIGSVESGELVGATRVIQCPLTVPSGRLAVQVVDESDYKNAGVISVHPGHYRVTMSQRVSPRDPSEIQVGLWATPTQILETTSKVLVVDGQLSVSGPLLETAEKIEQP